MAATPPADYAKPLPRPTAESAPFWEACRRHELALQCCTACGRFWFPPANRCAHCWSETWEWTPVSGRGRVFTFTVFQRAFHRAFVDEVPYAVAVVELEEGPRLMSNVVGCGPDEVSVGMPVTVVFDDVTPEVTLPRFRPA